VADESSFELDGIKDDDARRLESKLFISEATPILQKLGVP